MRPFRTIGLPVLVVTALDGATPDGTLVDSVASAAFACDGDGLSSAAGGVLLTHDLRP